MDFLKIKNHNYKILIVFHLQAKNKVVNMKNIANRKIKTKVFKSKMFQNLLM